MEYEFETLKNITFWYPLLVGNEYQLDKMNISISQYKDINILSDDETLENEAKEEWNLILNFEESLLIRKLDIDNNLEKDTIIELIKEINSLQDLIIKFKFYYWKFDNNSSYFDSKKDINYIIDVISKESKTIAERFNELFN